MFVYIASDHAGYEMKENLKKFLIMSDYKVKDFGADEFASADDYTDYMHSCASELSVDVINNVLSQSRAIILGGSGTGEAIVANRYEGVRAVVCNSDNIEIVKLGRQHNDANVLSIGARFVSDEIAIEAVKTFLETKFIEDERHVRRLKKIDTDKIIEDL
jgi:ribose 5-phosphate isomerase B